MDVSTVDNKRKSINKSIASFHHNVTRSLIALHALPGYNSVPMMFGIPNCAHDVWHSQIKDPENCQQNTPEVGWECRCQFGDIMREGKQFAAKRYG